MKALAYICFLLVISSSVCAQVKIINHCPNCSEKIYFKHKSNSITDAKQSSDDYRIELINKGYLTAGIDSFLVNKDSLINYWHIGDKYSFAHISYDESQNAAINKANLGERFLTNRPINPKHLAKGVKELISYYQNHGHPFTSVSIEIDSLNSNLLYARLEIDIDRHYLIDSIIVKGMDVNPALIRNAIRYKEGDSYNQKLLNETTTRIKELSFVKLLRSPELVYNEKGADVYIYIEKRNANKFNGILGVLPDPNTGKINFTGEINLGLINAFNAGESFYLQWQKLQTSTQQLDIDLSIPYIFKLPLGIGGNFYLYKRDSTYIEIKPELNIRFPLAGNNYLGIFADWYQSNLLQVDQFDGYTQIPRLNDTKKNNFGIDFKFTRLDYAFNPRKGIDAKLKASVGRKQILYVPGVDSAAYNNIDLRTNNYQISGKIVQFIPILKRMSIMLGAKGSALVNPLLFVNEMFRIGGLTTIRGFDDQSIQASSYIIGTAEYRFLLEQNSYIYAFTDQGFYENNNSEFYQNGTTQSYGLGVAFETKPGIFTINYALGKLDNNPIEFRSAKIHFGFVNYF